jgi:hypothetical protein
MRNSGLLVWTWLPGTHMIGMFHSWDASRGNGGVHTIWQDRLSWSTPEIGYDSGLADFDSTEEHMQDMIHSGRVGSSRHYSFGLREWRLQFIHEGQTIMIRVAQRHHDGLQRRLQIQNY